MVIMGIKRTEMKGDLLSAQEAVALPQPPGSPTAAWITVSKCLCNLIFREEIHFVPFAALRGISQPLFRVCLIQMRLFPSSELKDLVKYLLVPVRTVSALRQDLSPGIFLSFMNSWKE